MNHTDILDRLTRILRDLLFDESIVLEADTTRPDVPGWDSFNYVNFIVAVELEYGVKFSIAEVESFVTVGEIAKRVVELAGD